jgi:hypothetical protein
VTVGDGPLALQVELPLPALSLLVLSPARDGEGA